MNKEKIKMMRYPFLVTLIGSILLVLMLLLPYASAKGDYKEYLKAYKDEIAMEETGMTNGEAVNISLVEFLRLYGETAKKGIQKEISIVCVVVISMFAVFAVFTLLMALLKKPVGIIIFDLFAMGIFQLLHFDFKDRGVISNSSYGWGLADYLTYFIGAAIFAGAVWMFVEKRKEKKAVETTTKVE